MGLIAWLKTKLGEDKATKLLAIIGGLFIFLVGNFPLSEMVSSFNLAPAVSGYIILAWSGFIIAFSSIIILFFGGSERFPPTGTSSIIEEVVDTPEEVVAAAEELIEEAEEVISAPVEEPVV